MKKFHSDSEAFDRICGDCTGVDIDDITDEDIITQAKSWAEQGEPCSEEMVEAAIRHLEVLKNTEI